MPDRLPSFRPGDELKASDLQALADYARANTPIVAPGGGLVAFETPAGRAIAVERRYVGPIRLTGTSGTGYTWHRVTGRAGGLWDEDTSLSDATAGIAYEYNGNTGLGTDPGTIVEAWYDPATGEVRFSKQTCDGGGGGTPPDVVITQGFGS
jgi:hypothetical protein